MLTKLFSGWPASNLAQIHSDPNEPEYRVCGHYYAVTNQAYGYLGFSPMRRAFHTLSYLLGESDVAPIWARITNNLRNWLDVFRPEIVFSQTGNLPFLRLTRRIVEYTGAQLVLHACDDWVSDWPANITQRRVPVIFDSLARAVHSEYAELTRMASLRLAISQMMAAEYGRRFGGSWQVLFNPIDPNDWPDRTLRQPHDGPFRMLYSGTVAHTSQLETLFIVARAVTELRSEGKDVELSVSTRPVEPALEAEFKRLGVTLVDLVPVEALPNRLASADLLLLPITFDPLRFKFIRLSIPAKTSEYMASGTPVLVVGPETNAMVENALKERWAFVVTRSSVSAIKGEIVRAMQDADVRSIVARRAREIAVRDFDVHSMRRRLTTQLTALVGPSTPTTRPKG